MKAIIEKKKEIQGHKEYKEITKITWYFLCIPIFHSEVTFILSKKLPHRIQLFEIHLFINSKRLLLNDY